MNSVSISATSPHAVGAVDRRCTEDPPATTGLARDSHYCHETDMWVLAKDI